MTNFKSHSANIITGVDIQGSSDGIKLENNYVNLDPAVGDVPDDKWCGLRIRQAAGTVIVKQNNYFVQGVVTETRRKLHEYHPRPAGIEWPNNGCPFNQ